MKWIGDWETIQKIFMKSRNSQTSSYKQSMTLIFFSFLFSIFDFTIVAICFCYKTHQMLREQVFSSFPQKELTKEWNSPLQKINANLRSNSLVFPPILLMLMWSMTISWGCLPRFFLFFLTFQWASFITKKFWNFQHSTYHIEVFTPRNM
jgi:hypothetical protein